MNSNLLFKALKLTEDHFEIIFNDHEFPTPDGMLRVLTGDSLVINGEFSIDVLGYGSLHNEHSLKMFFRYDNLIYNFEMFELAEMLLSQEIVFTKFIDSENNKYFNKRISKIFDVKELEALLSKMEGITLKGKGARKSSRLYELEQTQIGNPDWTILFKYGTNKGNYSLGKISSLTREFVGKVFLQCHNVRTVEKFTGSTMVFFSLSGVDITPEQCVVALKIFEIDKQLVL